MAQSEIVAVGSNVSARGRSSGADGGAESSPMGHTRIHASTSHFQLTLSMQMAGDHAAGCLLEGRNEMPSCSSTTSQHTPIEICHAPPPAPGMTFFVGRCDGKGLRGRVMVHRFLPLGSYLSNRVRWIQQYDSHHQLARVCTSPWFDMPFGTDLETTFDSLVRRQNPRMPSQQAPCGLAHASLRWAHGYKDLETTTRSLLPRRCKLAPR